MAGGAFLPRFLRDRGGATMVEYGLTLAVAALVILGIAELLGSAAIDNFNALSQGVQNAQDTAQGANQNGG